MAEASAQRPTRAFAPIQQVRRLLDFALLDQVERDHQQPDREFRRRRIVSGITIVIGAVLLGFSLATEPGDPAFYAWTTAVAVVWFVGGFYSGPLHLGYIPFRGVMRRPIITPFVIGLVASAVFVVGGVVIRYIEPLREIVARVLDHAYQGNIWLIALIALLNGAGEEVFFRGALYSAIGRKHPIPISVVIYAIVTIATGNPVLVFAALIMGTVFGLQRRATGGILAPIITHLTWSVVMLLALPPIIGVPN